MMFTQMMKNSNYNLQNLVRRYSTKYAAVDHWKIFSHSDSKIISFNNHIQKLPRLLWNEFDISTGEPTQDNEKGITIHEATYVGERFVLVAVRKKDDPVQEPLQSTAKLIKKKVTSQYFCR